MESNDSIGICCFLLFLVVYILFTLIKNGILEICFLKYHFVNNLRALGKPKALNYHIKYKYEIIEIAKIIIDAPAAQDDVIRLYLTSLEPSSGFNPYFFVK